MVYNFKYLFKILWLSRRYNARTLMYLEICDGWPDTGCNCQNCAKTCVVRVAVTQWGYGTWVRVCQHMWCPSKEIWPSLSCVRGWSSLGSDSKSVNLSTYITRMSTPDAQRITIEVCVDSVESALACARALNQINWSLPWLRLRPQCCSWRSR